MLKHKRLRQSRLMDEALVTKINDSDVESEKDIYTPQKDDLFDLFDVAEQVELEIERKNNPKAVKSAPTNTGFGVGSVILLVFMTVVFLSLCVGAYLLI